MASSPITAQIPITKAVTKIVSIVEVIPSLKVHIYDIIQSLAKVTVIEETYAFG